MKKLSFVVLAALLLNGCATSRDGIVFGGGPSDSKKALDEIKNKMTKTGLQALHEETANNDIVQLDKVGYLVVGELGPFRELDESDKKKMYKQYLKYVENYHSGIPAELTESEYINAYSGWTSVEVWSIPGVFWRRATVMVPKEIHNSLGYASTFGSVMVGTTGDLVGCRYSNDGIGHVEKLLCKEGDKECYKSYSRGLYEVNSGREISASNLDLLNNNRKIDTVTYKVISK